jgi:hypothetical protein
MLLAMVIISGFFTIVQLITVGYLSAHNQHDGAIIGNAVQAVAWAFFFVVNLIALVK